jgi:demethylmenaquinone methyltransferase/2-methoxy-6-polyprenyl-1,4-benzoquinol methylase
VINQEKIVEFFDRLAPQWDADMIRNDEVINKILDNANVTEGKSVLDVACGTGVLIPDYLERKVSSVTAIDI